MWRVRLTKEEDELKEEMKTKATLRRCGYIASVGCSSLKCFCGIAEHGKGQSIAVLRVSADHGSLRVTLA